MLKLPKGLKKKKKGKKSKKDQELFNEEELEQYRREHQKQQQPEHQSGENPSASNDDEWSKFLALTSGVDSVLKQKQEDLDRIKSTSFFQRVPPPSEVKREAELKHEEEEAAKAVEEEQKKQEKKEDIFAEAVVELSESESEEDDADDIFDTAYIDVIANAEVGLVNVDSPEDEEAEGPDPFDTSYAEKVIKGPEVSKRGKKLVSIGSAVQVLTGRVETVSTVTSRRPRRGPKDLLLENFDSLETGSIDLEPSSSEPIKTLLDDLADEIPDIPIDLSVSLHIQLQKDLEEKKSEELQHNKENFEKSIVNEFDVIAQKNLEDDDEFAQLAVESLTKKEDIHIIKEAHFEAAAEGDWAFFEQSKEKPPRPITGPHIPSAVSDEDLSFQEDSSDPFDTAFVERILPATLAEDADFDPRADSPILEKYIEKTKPAINENLFSPEFEGNLLNKFETPDLLKGSNTDLSNLTHSPLAPTTANGKDNLNQNLSEDPFDTSAVDSIVAPGKTELKFLEKEFLTESSGLKYSLSDPDFDPRGDSDSPIIQSDTADTDHTASRKQSLALNIQPAGSKLVSFLVPTTDLLKTDDHGKIQQKPLTPYYTKKSIVGESESDEQDPFDTSYISEIKPTELELNLLEKDLLKESHLKHSLSDPDFNPRADSPKQVELKKNNTDLLGTSDINYNSKVLTPAVEAKSFESSYIADPFDTSSITTKIQPGTTELKFLVNEFIPQIETDTDIFADSQESVFAGKVLTPQPPEHLNSIEDTEIDPFDTSFASNLRPGQAEIRAIETELINN